jgi:hypothetical protein
MHNNNSSNSSNSNSNSNSASEAAAKQSSQSSGQKGQPGQRPLDLDLTRILMGRRPRRYGEMPTKMGAYTR